MMFGSATKTEAAFYDAFQQADLEAMMLAWDDHEAVCIHPFGERIEGKEAVTRSWQVIFSHNVRLSFTLSDVLCFDGDTLAVHLVFENISVVEEGEVKTTVVLATNAYRLTENGWRMVLHHASPVPATAAVATNVGRVH